MRTGDIHMPSPLPKLGGSAFRCGFPFPACQVPEHSRNKTPILALCPCPSNCRYGRMRRACQCGAAGAWGRRDIYESPGTQRAPPAAQSPDRLGPPLPMCRQLKLGSNLSTTADPQAGHARTVAIPTRPGVGHTGDKGTRLEIKVR